MNLILSVNKGIPTLIPRLQILLIVLRNRKYRFLYESLYTFLSRPNQTDSSTKRHLLNTFGANFGECTLLK